MTETLEKFKERIEACTAYIRAQQYDKVHVETIFSQLRPLFGAITNETHPTEGTLLFIFFHSAI